MNKKIKDGIKSIKEGVLEQVQEGKVSMHSRYYFLLRAAAGIVGGVFLFGFALYMASMVVFIFAGNGMSTLPELGFVGVFIMLRSLPWLLILIVIALVVSTLAYGSKFSFVYKRPLIFSLIGVVVLITIGGILLAQTSMHHKAFKFGEEYRVPFASKMYKEYVLRGNAGLRIGTISSIISDGNMTVQLRNGSNVNVIITNNTKLPRRRVLKKGDVVMIVGDYKNNEIQAIGVRPLERKHTLMPMRHKR